MLIDINKKGYSLGPYNYRHYASMYINISNKQLSIVFTYHHKKIFSYPN